MYRFLFPVRQQRYIHCFWQTNLSRNNDDAVCLTSTRNNGDDATTTIATTTWRRMECVQSSARQRTLHRVNVSPSWIACSVLPCSLSPPSMSRSLSLALFVYVYIYLLSLSNSVRHLYLSNHSLIRSLVYSVDLPDGISVVGGEHWGSLPLRNQDRRGRWIAILIVR